MGDVVIRAEGLGKKYLIGHQSAGRESYTALRDVISRQAKALVRSARDMLQGRQIVAGDEVEEFWALKDVSFEIKRGEVLGFIGRNGAGKSTLLKVLSRITEPSTGRAEIKGRVASLLEVGTGFHPELTGRENIYLNGAILGMSRMEIRRKFDEIVAFAEIEKFLDTPVKRYSSGMYIRLAFAVAAHLEPEILIVDEVLAVGDAEFQKKCIGKMQDVAGHGRTVLFVSHNFSAVRSLCTRAIEISKGTVIDDGAPEEVVANHLLALQSPMSRSSVLSVRDHSSQPAIVLKADIIGKDPFYNGESLKIEFDIAVTKAVKMNLFLYVWREGDLAFVASDHHLNSTYAFTNKRTVLKATWTIPGRLLNPGNHSFGLSVVSPDAGVYYAHHDQIVECRIHDDGIRRGGVCHIPWGGYVSPILDVVAEQLDVFPSLNGDDVR